MILCDTGVLLCLVDTKQAQHKKYRDVIQSEQQHLITTWSCLTEAMYLLYRCGGWPMQKQLGQLLVGGILTIQIFHHSDYDRILELMQKYKDRPMDFADATLVMAAERTGITRILTLDSDFLFYRINDRSSFEII
jgi:predicted nucleic acid-binding protein